MSVIFSARVSVGVSVSVNVSESESVSVSVSKSESQCVSHRHTLPLAGTNHADKGWKWIQGRRAWRRCRVQSSGFGVQGSGCRVQGAVFKVQGSGLKGWGRSRP